MAVLLPGSSDEAIDLLGRHPGATVLAGGTDLMVEVNGGHRGLDDVLVLAGVDDLKGWRSEPEGSVTLGARLTYTEMLRPPLCDLLPALAEAARTVGSPQIRNAGTLGGNLGTASPAGDALPVLSALDATIVLAGPAGRRSLPVHQFLTGVKRTARRADELVVAAEVPLLDGWQGFAKVGVRNAMVIAITSACLATDRRRRRVHLALGSVGPTVLRAHAAEDWVTERLDWETGGPVEEAVAAEFGRRAAALATPIDDHRSTAAYRARAVSVLARRLLVRAFPDRSA